MGTVEIMETVTERYGISTDSPYSEMLDLGKILAKNKWNDAEIQKEFGQDYRYWFINLSREFYKLSTALKFRAMVESWTPETVAVACGIDPEEIPEDHQMRQDREESN